MTPQCCRDSVASRVLVTQPYEGMRVECRWCWDGYGVYRDGQWQFSTETADRVNHASSPEQTAKRAARIREILGKD